MPVIIVTPSMSVCPIHVVPDGTGSHDEYAKGHERHLKQVITIDACEGKDLNMCAIMMLIFRKILNNC